MAKKKTAGTTNSADSAAPAAKPARRRVTARGGSAQAAAARADDASASPLKSGNGSALSVSAPSSTVLGSMQDVFDPSYDQIAEAAYGRYLSRGGNHGSDFDDWIEAERELRQRHA